MYSHLLKKALPFTLTLVVGVALGGLFYPRGTESPSWASWHGGRHEFGYGEKRRHRRCRMRRHHLVAETKPLNILYKPDAGWPRGVEPGAEGARSAVALVTFGADGKVGDVRPLASGFRVSDEDLIGVKATWEAVERAARQIQFVPETVDGRPVTVEREVEIRFLAD